MTPLTLFLTLMLLALIGSLLSERPELRSMGMASGIEFVVIGILVGPHLLGLITHQTVSGFEPLLLMALGWLAAALGIQHGVYEDRWVGLRVYFAGVALATVTGGGVLAATYLMAVHLLGWGVTDSVLLALGCFAVCAGTTHLGVRWVTEDRTSEHPLSRLLGGLSVADDLPPLLALAVLSAWAPSADATLPLSGWVWALAGLGLGVALGATVAALLGRTLERTELWPVLLGAVLLVVGIALRLDWPLLTTSFLFGATLALLSPHRQVIRRLVVRTERPLLLPSLLLAGALVELPHSSGEWLLVGLAVLVRLALQFVGGAAVARSFAAPREASPALRRALMPAGSASLAIGLTVLLRHPGGAGRVVLVVAVAVTLVGELVGGRALRRVLTAQNGASESEPPGVEVSP